MSKKDPTKTKSFDIVGSSSYVGGGTIGSIYVEREKDFDPHEPSKADIYEVNKTKKAKAFFNKIRAKLLNKTTPLQQTTHNLTPNEKEQPINESFSCHICGNICKEKDYFCPECGAKLKVGHFND